MTKEYLVALIALSAFVVTFFASVIAFALGDIDTAIWFHSGFDTYPATGRDKDRHMSKRIIVDRSKKEDGDGRFHMQSVSPVDDLQVAPWSPGDVEKGDPLTQVHILFTPPMEALIAAWNLKRGIPMVSIRLKSRAVVDSLIAALIEHRDKVWPEEKGESL